MTAPLLELEHITKAFPGVVALDDVSFDLHEGEVHALVGENGAGKSTLVKIISGVYQPDRGVIRLAAIDRVIRSPVDARRLGISPVHQELALEPALSVAENIFLGRQPRTFGRLVDWRAMRQEARRVLDGLGIDLDPSTTLDKASIAQRQMVAIARALSTDARVLLFDEPTSSLTDTETQHLFSVIRDLRTRGLGVIYISHRLEEVQEITDRLTVLRDGRHIATVDTAATNLPAIIRMMIGRDMTEMYPEHRGGGGAPALEVSGLSRRGVLQDISLTVHKGEIVGVAGLIGAGQAELALCLFGALSIGEGIIAVDGRTVKIKSPNDAVRCGIALIPEDRKTQGLVTPFTVARNISLASLKFLSRLGLINFAAEGHLAERFIEQLAIRTPGPRQVVSALSGGNQQRVVIAKWLATSPRVLIVHEPTRGIDVSAKASIHRLIVDLARAGVGILLISSDLPEVVGMSDRIVVMHRGRIAGSLSGSLATQDSVMQLATGQLVEGRSVNGFVNA
jgi:ribose transport system ATP-binding protein